MNGYNGGSGWLIQAWMQGRLDEVGLGCRYPAKGAMRHVWKIANRAIVACAGKNFGESPGKISGENVLGKIW